MNIFCVGYRQWALNIYDRLTDNTDHEFIIVRSQDQYNEKELLDRDPDLVLFYGWSWIMSREVVSRFNCVMLHPSPLPKYRGGSPIQNQIIAGEATSAVSLFRMTEKLDAGNIVGQREISLDGTISEIFQRIEDAGFLLTLEFLRGNFTELVQDDSEASYCARRAPEDSELTIEELQSNGSKYLYNKIRMLADPYPNAFIRTIDNKKLLIKVAEIEN